jgi:hypothetical protein
MTDKNTPVSENDLHAYVDGFLDPLLLSLFPSSRSPPP